MKIVKIENKILFYQYIRRNKKKISLDSDKNNNKDNKIHLNIDNKNI